MHTIFVCILAIISCLSVVIADELCHGENAQFQLIYTTTGTIRGVTCANLGYSVFKGIPYAASTEGANRWHPPQPVEPWNGILDTLEYAPSCPQIDNGFAPNKRDISEDCLHLNVWVPTTPSPTPFPVFVWIHGGGFIWGSGNIERYWGDFIANTSNIVVVTINYRLGALGFMNGPNMTGNYGFMDQQAALQWVQKNIRAFNGDPQRVTIAGQSAGAMSVGLHMISPQSKGLFQRTIMESNPYGLLYRTPTQSQPISSILAKDMGCDINDMICLRKVNITTILSKQDTNEFQITFPFSTREVLFWMPLIDGHLIPDQPLTLLSTGAFHTEIPVLMGTTRNETVGFVSNTLLEKLVGWEYDIFVAGWFTLNAPKVLSMFPAEGNYSIDSLRHLFTSYVFTCGARYAAQQYANLGAGAYLYQFLHVPTQDVTNPSTPLCSTTAVCHSAELTFVFGTAGFNNQTMTSSEQRLSQQIMSYWSAFVYGAPVDEPLQPADDILPWPPLNNGTYPSMILDIPLSTTIGYQSTYCDVFDGWGYVY